MSFPLQIDGPVHHELASSCRNVNGVTGMTTLWLSYGIIAELALSRRDDTAITESAPGLAALDEGLAAFDLAVGSLRALIGDTVSDMLLTRIDAIGLPEEVSSAIYVMCFGHLPVVHGNASGQRHPTLVRIVLSRLYRVGDRTPQWVRGLDAALDRFGLCHHMSLDDLFVDKNLATRTREGGGLYPMTVGRPVHMCYGNRLEWLELPAEITADLKTRLGIRFVFELGLLAEYCFEEGYKHAAVVEINRVLATRGLFLRVGNLFTTTAFMDAPPDVPSRIGDGFAMPTYITEKTGSPTLFALPLLSPDELGLTPSELEELQMFLGFTFIGYNRSIHDVIVQEDRRLFR